MNNVTGKGNMYGCSTDSTGRLSVVDTTVNNWQMSYSKAMEGIVTHHKFTAAAVVSYIVAYGYGTLSNTWAASYNGTQYKNF